MRFFNACRKTLIIFCCSMFLHNLEASIDLIELDLEELMEIQVEVASYFPESEIKSPSTISSLTREQWMSRGAKHGLKDLLGHLPGVVTYSTLGGTGVAIRGFVRNTPVARGKAYMLDGVPLNSLTFRTGFYGRAHLNLNLFERMEMVRGPGSALYGSDAFHGVISLKTYEPSHDESEVFIALSDHKYSEFNLRNSFMLNDQTRLSTALSTNGQGGQNLLYTSRVPALTGRTWERDETLQAGSILIKLDSTNPRGDRWKFSFLSHQFETDESPGNANFHGNEDVGSFDTRFNLFKFEQERKLSNREDFHLYAYRWSSAFEESFPRPALDPWLATQKDIRSGLGVRYKLKESQNQPIRLVAGAEIDKLEIPDAHAFPRFNSGYIPEPHHGYAQKVKSLYLQARKPFFENKIYAHVGARSDRYPEFGNQLTPRIGFTYHPDSRNTWKILYGNAFRAPSGGEARGLLGLSSQNIQPEEIDTMEYVYMYKGKQSLVSLTWFDSSWEEGIIPNFGTNMWENSGRNESSGLEFSIKRIINREWELELSGSRIQSRNLVSQQEYEAFPEEILNLLANYQPRDSRWSLYTAIRYMSQWKDGTAQTSQPLRSYLRTDLSLGFEVSRDQKIYLWIRNLFDRDLKIPSVWNSEEGIPEPGRAIGIGWKYQF